MLPSLDSFRAVRRQGNAVITAQALAALLQQQHPASPLGEASRRQFERCCALLATRAALDAPAEQLLLAADVCFNYAYVVPGQSSPGYCPRHRL
jgi:hypothetical protein